MLTTAGNFLFRYRNFLFPVACALLFLPGPDLFQDPILAALLGAAIAACGQLVRVGTIGLRYIVRGGRGRRVYAEDLVTDGIYAHTRNPMYVGNLLIVAGLAVASNSWATLLVALPLAGFLYRSIVAAEEDYLRQRFGSAFIEYCRDVPRWVPRLSGLRQTLSSMQFRWRRLIVKEYGTPVGWINVLAAMTLYNIWTSGNWATQQQTTSILGGIMLVTTLLWFVARGLKKSRRMVAD